MHQSNLQPRINMHLSSEQYSRTDEKTFQRSLNPHSGARSHTNISKRGGVSFNLGRVIPRQIAQDKESLYAENLKLREENKELRDNNVKLKTRLSVTEKQKQHMYDNISYVDVGIPRSGSKSLPRGQKSAASGSLQKQNFMKKMLRQAREEAEKYKKQNANLKKTLKYTQLSQINIQNQRLAEECSRLHEILSSGVMVNNAEQIQAQLHNLRADLKLEKESTKTLMMQMKRKDQEIQKCKDITTQDQQKIKKMNKQIYYLRNQRKNGKAAIIPLSKQQKSKVSTLSPNSMLIQSCQKCKKLEKQLGFAQAQVSLLNKQLRIVEVSSAHSSKRIQEGIKKKYDKIDDKSDEQLPKSFKKKEKFQQNQKKLTTQSFDEYQEQFEEEAPKIQQKNQKKTVGQKVQDKKNEEIINETKKKDEKKINSSAMQEQYEVDEFEDEIKEENQQKQVKVNEKQNPQKSQNKKQEKQQQIMEDDYDDEGFDEQLDEQNIKQDKQEKQKPQQNAYSSQKILKQTITYKLITQRYEYSDLIEDLSNSGMKQLKVQDLANILNNQPFFLAQDQIEQVLQHILGKSEDQSVDLENTVKTSVFTKKIKDFIEDFTLLPQEKQQKIQQQIKEKITKNNTKLLKQFKTKKKSDKQIVTKEQFIKIMSENDFSKQEVNIALAQSMLVSKDILSINYKAYINGISEQGN